MVAGSDGAGGALDAELRGYVAQGGATRDLIVNIESAPALAALDDILAVDGLDGVLVGPHDLSCSLGLPEQYDHPRFLAACDEVIGKALGRSLSAGVHVFYERHRLLHEERWARLGANFIMHAGDILFFAEGIRRAGRT